MQSNVFALNRDTGEVRWEKRYDVPSEGPNGVTAGYGMIYGSTGDDGEVFALDAQDGHEIWRVKLTTNPSTGIDIAPVVYNNVVYVSTVPGRATSSIRVDSVASSTPSMPRPAPPSGRSIRRPTTCGGTRA